jgi:hypothetical protein
MPRRVSARTTLAQCLRLRLVNSLSISSPARSGPHTVVAAAADIVEAVAALGRPPDAVIGHSFGGKARRRSIQLQQCMRVHCRQVLYRITLAASGRAVVCRAKLCDT